MSKRGRQLAVHVTAILAVGLLVGCARSPQAREARSLKRGQAFLEKKDYARATLEFQNAAKFMPRDAEPRYQLGLVYLQAGNVAAAIASLQQATSINPKHAAAQLALAEMMVTSQRKEILQDAEKRLREVIAESPNSVDAIEALARAESNLGKPGDAAKLFDEAVEKAPADLRAAVRSANFKISQKDFTGAEEVLRKAVKAAPNSPDAALALGRLYIQRGRASEGETEVRQALALNPKSAPALLSLAVIQLNTNRAADAEQTYKQLASLPNKDYKPMYGLFLFQQGKQEAALAEFSRLANADPDNRDARTRLIAAYVQLNKIPEAEAVLAKALNRNPKDNDALSQRTELRWRSHDVAGALKDVQEVLKLQPNSAVAHYQLAKIKTTQGFALTARQELNQSLSLDPRYLPARLALARTYVSASDFQSALNLLDQVPQSQKNNLGLSIQRNWALIGLGRAKEARQEINLGLNTVRTPELVEEDGFLKLQEGDYAGAQRDAEELLTQYPEQEPDNIRAVRLLVSSCEAQHQKSKALEEVRKAVSKRPKSAELQTLLGRTLIGFGNAAEARTAFEAALAADPNYLAPEMELAQLDVADNRLDAAQQLLSKILASDPQNLLARLMLADAEATAGLRPAAIANFQSVLDTDGSNVIALTNLAILIATDNPDAAFGLAQKAVELAPDDASTQDALGLVYYRKGIYRSAAEHLKIAAAKEPTARRQFHLAMSYLKAGDRDLGQEMLSAALKKDPNLMKTEQGW